MKKFLSTLLLLLVASSAWSATYFVDFSAGSDLSLGTSTGTAWKHAPGDANALGVPLATILNPGDTVNFKGGVSYNGTITITPNGTAGSPIIYTTGSGWGSGNAIMEGTVGGVTNQEAFFQNGNNTIVQNLTIQDYTNAFLVQGNNCIISNNIIHHMGTFPWDSTQGSSQGGYGVYGSGQTGMIVVSNKIYDLNYNGVSGVNITNGIVWGNEIYLVQNHGQQFWTYGWTLNAWNYTHDETNGFNHSDAIQVLGQPLGQTNILCFNTYSNCIDNMNVQPFFVTISNTNLSGYFFVFGNVTMNGQPGVSGLVGNANGSEFDTYGNDQGIYVFNNTFVDHNAGWGGYRNPTYRDVSLTISNAYMVDNIYFNSLGGWNDGYTNGHMKAIYTGYNVYTNSYRSGVTLAGDTNAGNNTVTLATYQSDMAAQSLEQNSIYGSVAFVNYAVNGSGIQTAGNFKLASGSAGIGNATNLSSLFPSTTFNFLPAGYKVDPTKDAAGVQRVASGNWDVGAFAFNSNNDPIITVQPQNQRVSTGQTASFSVTATTSNPPLTYQWSKNGTSIPGATQGSYTTPAEVIGDNGATFSVQVCNNLSACVQSSSATLTVLGYYSKKYGSGTHGSSSR